MRSKDKGYMARPPYFYRFLRNFLNTGKIPAVYGKDKKRAARSLYQEPV